MVGLSVGLVNLSALCHSSEFCGVRSALGRQLATQGLGIVALAERTESRDRVTHLFAVGWKADPLNSFKKKHDYLDIRSGVQENRHERRLRYGRRG
jgi:hypothetical protein